MSTQQGIQPTTQRRKAKSASLKDKPASPKRRKAARSGSAKLTATSSRAKRPANTAEPIVPIEAVSDFADTQEQAQPLASVAPIQAEPVLSSAEEVVEPCRSTEVVDAAETPEPVPVAIACDTVEPAQPEEITPAEPEKASTNAANYWKHCTAFFLQAWSWLYGKMKSHQVRKRLRVCETVSLGEKRFVAVIQVDGEQFLVGGSSSSVSTLAHLQRSHDFSDVFQRHCEQDLSRA